MRVIFTVLALCIAAWAASCDCSGNRRSLIFRGAAPTDMTGTGADDAAVIAALGALMTNRIYDPNTYMVYGCTKSNKSRINNGQVITVVHTPDVHDDVEQSATGAGIGEGVYYVMTFALLEGRQLSVSFIYNVGQHLLFEVGPENGASTSASTTFADCTLRGTLASKTVDLAFKQELSGEAGFGYYGYY
jgi:hypothetical protein